MYIEALSQGLPVVYSKGQGIDGYFSSGAFVEAIDPSSVESIARGILSAGNEVITKRESCILHAQAFSWKNVSGKYHEIYNSLV